LAIKNTKTSKVSQFWAHSYKVKNGTNTLSDLDRKQENNIIRIESLFNLSKALKYPSLIRKQINSAHIWVTRHQIRNSMYDKDSRCGNLDMGNHM